MDRELDYMGPRNFSTNRVNEKFEDLLDRFGLEDIWRKRNPDKKQFTLDKSLSYIILLITVKF